MIKKIINKIDFNKIKRLIPLLKRIFIIGLILFLVGIFGIEFNTKKNTTTSPPVVTKKISKPAKNYSDFHLLIPIVNISVSVIPDVDGNDKNTYFKALENGVAHFKGTAKPGENSNIFIFGHSSFYASSPGEYKKVFAHLDDLKKGDEISLWFKGKEYKYKVFKTFEVEPTEVDVLKPTPTEQLTLMTCWPPGTTLKRLIIIAKPI